MREQLMIQTDRVYSDPAHSAGRGLHCQRRHSLNRPLPMRLDLWNHSPTGFEFGYGGSGPAQLALAILADCCGDELAVTYHQAVQVGGYRPLPRPRRKSDRHVRARRAGRASSQAGIAAVPQQLNVSGPCGPDVRLAGISNNKEVCYES
jgi:hypothetical protein